MERETSFFNIDKGEKIGTKSKAGSVYSFMPL